MRAIVIGRGREVVPGSGDTGYRDGLEVEATLVKRIGNRNSESWFVSIDGDTNEKGAQETRSRRIVRIIP